MTSILITKESFNRVKKAFKAAISKKLNIEPKLSEVAQIVAQGLGFDSEHEIQKHFEKEPSEVSAKISSLNPDTQFTAIGVYMADDVYFRARQSSPQSILLKNEQLAQERIYFYPADMPAPLSLGGFSERRLYVKTSSLVQAFAQFASPNAYALEKPSLELFWDKPGHLSVLSQIEKEIALHFANNPQTGIQKLSFDYADYGLDLFVMALNKQKTDIEGFGFYYCDDIYKYKDKEMGRLGLTQQDIDLINKLLEVGGLTKSKEEKEKISTEIKYEVASALGLKNMNSNLLDEKNYFEYTLYQNSSLSGVVSIYPHGLFQPKMKQIKVNPQKVFGESSSKVGYKQFVQYNQEAHAEGAVAMKIPVYTSLYDTIELQYIPVAWVQNWVTKSKKEPQITTNFL